jgi:hypothetical protein
LAREPYCQDGNIVLDSEFKFELASQGMCGPAGPGPGAAETAVGPRTCSYIYICVSHMYAIHDKLVSLCFA